MTFFSHNKSFRILSFPLVLGILSASAFAAEWQIDPLHSGAQFAVRHMMISTVHGQFGGVKGTVVLDDSDLTKSRVDATVDATTLNTGNPGRDHDLKDEEFFDIEKHPTLDFHSKRVELAGPGHLRVTGDLTMRGVTREVTLDVEGPSPPIASQGVEKRGFNATTKINRRDFGFNYNKLAESVAVVSDEVSIELDIEIKRPVEQASAQTKQ